VREAEEAIHEALDMNFLQHKFANVFYAFLLLHTSIAVIYVYVPPLLSTQEACAISLRSADCEVSEHKKAIRVTSRKLVQVN
jgi:hypothetical protein